MNLQQYISSGIIESYVLGLASPEERHEFESMCNQYPELIQARTDFELSLEKAAMQNAVAPPAGLKEKIAAAIPPSASVRNLQAAPIRSMGWLKYAAAACLLLLIGSVYWNITLYNKKKDLQSQVDNTMAQLNESGNDVHIIGNPNIKMAAMRGQDVSPQSSATLYWDTASHDVYLVASNLPEPPSDRQYQLWALFDGKPIDLGMLEYKPTQKKLLVRMKNAQNAQAFAITLEKTGGNPTPQGKIYVMGKP